MSWFSTKTNVKVMPVEMVQWDYPVLVKKDNRYYSSYSPGHSNYTTYHEAATNGFYYEKDCVKYFRVQLDGEEAFYAENDLVFLKDIRA